MMLLECSEPSVPANPSDNELEQIPVRYKGWSIGTKVIHGKLWLRWQHPQESFSRYGCPVSEEGLAVTIDHVRFAIDLANRLESEALKFARS